MSSHLRRSEDSETVSTRYHSPVDHDRQAIGQGVFTH